MRKVHLISVTEPLVLDLALALREKGYEVSASGCGLTEEMIGRLHNAGCTCYGDGWFPEKLIKDIHSVVLGAKVKQDNPELLRAKELGMLIQSIPEFIFQRIVERQLLPAQRTDHHGNNCLLSTTTRHNNPSFRPSPLKYKFRNGLD